MTTWTTPTAVTVGNETLPCGRRGCRTPLGYLSDGTFRRSTTGDVYELPFNGHLRCPSCRYITDVKLTPVPAPP